MSSEAAHKEIGESEQPLPLVARCARVLLPILTAVSLFFLATALIIHWTGMGGQDYPGLLTVLWIWIGAILWGTGFVFLNLWAIVWARDWAWLTVVIAGIGVRISIFLIAETCGGGGEDYWFIWYPFICFIYFAERFPIEIWKRGRFLAVNLSLQALLFVIAFALT